MPILLHLHTGLEKAYVGISRDQEVLAFRENAIQKDHAAFLHPAIQSVIKEAGLKTDNLEAVSVINGPGSYTGLRVGLSAAKGLCYAIGTPLICLSTLEWLAWPFLQATTDLICPMIDARRMEVFTALYNRSLEPVKPEHPEILDEKSFPELEKHCIIFTGNGREKLPENIRSHKNTQLPEQQSAIGDQVNMALNRFINNRFDDIAYIEPSYGKAFYTTASIKSNHL
jgi:tRNA threonylcarbamoyladenosine biosynthesis protein TsaB